MEAEIKAMPRNTQHCQHPPEDQRERYGEDGTPSEPSEGTLPANTLTSDFALKDDKKTPHISIVLSNLICGNLLGPP